jgi:hypothetical protein
MKAGLDTILGRAFAVAGADAQAEVLNTAGLYARQTFGSRGDIEMQACYIADELNEDGWKFLRLIVQFDPQREA